MTSPAETPTAPRAPTTADLETMARRLGTALRDRGWRLATAESSTAGLIGHAVTMVLGASDYYVGGVITYANEAKAAELGVAGEMLAAHGAVSQEVAAAMAEGARRRFGVEVAVSVTGIAGPDGATAAKPVGTHYVAVAAAGTTRVERRVFPHDREGNKLAAALLALELAAEAAAGAG
jgi:PncC family amidohydrolase